MDRVAREAGDFVQAQFVHHGLPMFFDGLNADADDVRDLFVGKTFGNELEDFRFACRQVFVARA